MKILIYSLIFLTYSVVFCSFNADAKDPTGVLEILAKVEAEYGTLKSYSDSGSVNSDLKSIIFKTQYVKPDRFSFLWSSKLKTMPNISLNSAIWSDGKEVKKLFSYQKDIESEENLKMVIAEATGVSIGAAHNISSLLGLVEGFKKTNIIYPKLIGEDVIDNETCYQILGRHRKFDTTYELFISKTTFMIKKIIKNTKERRTVTIYSDISINQAMPDSAFDKKYIMEQLRKLP